MMWDEYRLSRRRIAFLAVGCVLILSDMRTPTTLPLVVIGDVAFLRPYASTSVASRSIYAYSFILTNANVSTPDKAVAVEYW
jgi:hypothetical protein